ncbi:MAG TPA: NADH-quinone oxidoreductase subunit J [Thermoanaerobaculia bacterium]|nr:NADH-quinone oxidoreductase subunit J [Thermoanaerobaculia bacterium]
MEPGLFFFWLFSAVVVVGAVGVVVMRQPIHSALFLLLSFLGVACLYVQARAELVAAVQVLVYAGGVMVLFLYTIMLVNVKRQRTERYLHRQAVPALGFGFLFLLVVGGVVVNEARALAGKAPAADPAALATTVIGSETVLGNTQAVGWVLYRDYLLPFEIASLFLLVAMIGAVVLGKRTMERFD